MDPATPAKAVDPTTPGEAMASGLETPMPGKAMQRGMDPALYKAATQGNVASLRTLVGKNNEILGSTTPQLNTVLHLPALHGNSKFARKVLDKNNELLVTRTEDDDAPLHLAAKAGKPKVAEVLIKRGAACPKPRGPSTVHAPPRNNILVVR